MRLTHRPTVVELNGNVGLHTHKDIHVSLYHWHKVNEDSKGRSMDGKLHVRVQHKNAIVSLGVEDLDVFNGKKPQVLSAWALLGQQKDNVTVYGGAYTGYNYNSKLMPFTELLLGVKHNKFVGHLNWAIKRTAGQKKEGETAEPATVVANEVKATFDSNIDSNTLVFGEAVTDLVTLKNFMVGGEYNLGGDTRIKAKATSNKDLSLSLIHKFNNMINFSFLTKVTITL